ncbi:N(4)-acetylcytidine aminohydrolase [Vibrio rumoiensis]|uniref:N(4)-acetylcytidine amidohydrolase n=1 Tax=Vibrio rumoiensis 1S-45 TaxID=1188252 RepID=A0A1E5DZ69_9VIBR|nr:N(4)-acetylcytidine aminohydrolase [Vibrio rumoiensis]OEF22598.1 ASCH domain-containing protein [Vibrio rumoiensis 1S-45]
MTSSATPTEMTFFARFEADILAGKKTITIRDEAESHYVPGSIVTVSTLEAGRVFCQLRILNVDAVLCSELNDFHAEQENMTLPQLQSVIQEIYPNIEQLYVIHYQLISTSN